MKFMIDLLQVLHLSFHRDFFFFPDALCIFLYEVFPISGCKIKVMDNPQS